MKRHTFLILDDGEVVGRVERSIYGRREIVGAYRGEERRFTLVGYRSFKQSDGFPKGTSTFGDSRLEVGAFGNGCLLLDEVRAYRMKTNYAQGTAQWVTDDEARESCVAFSGLESGVEGSVQIYDLAPAVDVTDLILHGLVALIFGNMRVWCEYA